VSVVFGMNVFEACESLDGIYIQNIHLDQIYMFTADSLDTVISFNFQVLG